MVILGTRGYPTADYVPLGCLQSSVNYPKQVATAIGVPKFYDALQLSPKATVFLVNYLAGIHEPGCYPFQPASNEDQVWLAQKLRELNAMVTRAAKAGGARLVDTYTPPIGHDACQLPNARYVEGFLPLSLNQPAIAVPFHPNSAGADAQATIVASAVTR